jgi:hypothetical protein
LGINKAIVILNRKTTMIEEVFTYQEGLDLAKRWGLESEYMACIADGMSPTEALEEWDLLPPETEEERE